MRSARLSQECSMIPLLSHYGDGKKAWYCIYENYSGATCEIGSKPPCDTANLNRFAAHFFDYFDPKHLTTSQLQRMSSLRRLTNNSSVIIKVAVGLIADTCLSPIVWILTLDVSDAGIARLSFVEVERARALRPWRHLCLGRPVFRPRRLLGSWGCLGRLHRTGS